MPIPGWRNYGQLLCAACVLFSMAVRAEWVFDRQAIMGTEINLTLWHDDVEAGKEAAEAVMAEMRRIDASLSPYKPDSELSLLNRQANTGPVVVSAELFEIVDKALYYSRISEGAFDISFATLGQHFNYREGRRPSKEEQQSLLPSIDFRQIKINRQARSLHFTQPQLQIDLGGIAKGYAVDRSIAILKNRGIEHATVSAGGDSRVLGDKRGKPWMVGIKNPRGEDSVALTVPLENTAISTSGDYERYFIDELSGERVHHIINPQTGNSAGILASVSVIGPQGFDTDPLSTTVFVLGPRKGMALIESMPGFECIIIDRSGKVSFSTGLGSP